MRVKAFLLLILTLLMAAALSSCALLPEEEETRSAPVLRTYETKAFNLAVVERGDLIQTQKVSSQYMPVQTAALCFELGGEYVDKMLVQLGDTVEKGQLLGQLQIGNLEEQIYNARSTIDELRIQIRYLTAQRELDMKRFEIEGQNMDPEARAEREKELQESFKDQLSRLNQSVSMQEMTLKDLERKLAERRIISPIDGTVTYVKEFQDGEMSVYASHVLTVADSSNSMFHAETKYWHLFESGDEYDIVANKKTYRAFVASEAELGIEAVRQEFIGDLAAEMLFGETSQLYLKLYEEGVVDGSFGGGFETIEGMALLTCFGDSESPETVKEGILQEARRLVETGVSDEDFLRMKRSALGRRIRDIDSLDGTSFRICAYYFSGYDYFDFPVVYQQVTHEDVLEFIQRVVTPDRCALSVIMPIEEVER